MRLGVCGVVLWVYLSGIQAFKSPHARSTHCLRPNMASVGPPPRAGRTRGAIHIFLGMYSVILTAAQRVVTVPPQKMVTNVGPTRPGQGR
jgi:hypothetical protein